MSTTIGAGPVTNDDYKLHTPDSPGAPLCEPRPSEPVDAGSFGPSISTGNPQSTVPIRVAALAEARCVGRFISLLIGRRLRRPTGWVGKILRFGDGTSSRVYRETVVAAYEPADPCVLVVAFRLRFVHGWGHRLFRAESLLNTPLFVGFPGFVSKLWLAHDEAGNYRGVYQWDGRERAEHYARSLWRLLALVSEQGSIRYHVVPGLRCDEILREPQLLATAAHEEPDAWWRLVEVT